MDWVEVALEVDGEAAEAVADVLRRYAHQGVLIEHTTFPEEVWEDETPPSPQRVVVRAYFPADAQTEERKKRLQEALWHLGQHYPIPEPRFAVMRDDDWVEAWKRHYHPLRLGRRLYIRPPWRTVNDRRPDDVMLVLDPGTAFGTGTHPTTQLCLLALEDGLAQGAQVLDLGCGSGILGIAALKLGAERVLALDTDALAVKATAYNAELNGVASRLTVLEGSLERVQAMRQTFDVLLCNILARVIVRLCDEGLGDVVREGGRAIFSGIIDTQVEEVEEALRRTGFEPLSRRTHGDWVAIEALKRASTAK